MSDGRADALATPLGVPVAELDGLVHSCRCAGRDDCAAERPGCEPDVHLDSRIATRIEHLAALHSGDLGHWFVPFASS